MNKDLQALLLAKLTPFEVACVHDVGYTDLNLSMEEIESIGECGSLPLVKHFHSKFDKWTNKTTENILIGATRGGHLNILQWCRETFDAWKNLRGAKHHITRIAFLKGHVHVLQWLVDTKLYYPL